MNPHRLRLLHALVPALALTFAAPDCPADVSVVDCAVGYENYCRRGSVAPFTLELTNESEGDVSGEAFVEVPLPNSSPLRFTRPVEMPAGARKRVVIYARLPRTGDPDAILVGYQPTRGGRVEMQVTPRVAPLEDVLVLECTDAEPRLQALRSINLARWYGTGPGAAGGAALGRGQVAVLHVTTEGLPDSWKGYDGLDLVVLDEFSPQVMKDDQRTALLSWIASGGHVLVTGGEQYRRLSESFIGAYLPMSVSGTTVLPSGPTALVSHFGGEMQATPTAVCTGRVVRGTVWVSQDGLPLLASCRVGLGTVWLATFSFTRRPVSAWDRMPEVASFILKHGRQYPPGMIGEHSERTLAQSLATYGGARPPSFKVISLFLLAYVVVLVPVNYVVLTRLRRRELAWITTPAIVVLFSLTAYGLGYVLKGRAVIVRSLSLVEVRADTGSGAAQCYYSLFSPRRDHYRVSFAVPSVDCTVPVTYNRSRPFGGGEPSLPTPFELRAGEHDSIHGLLVQMWDQRTFSARAPVVLDGVVEANLKLAERTVSGRMTNRLGLDLYDAVAVFRGQIEKLGRLDDGASVDLRISGVRDAHTTEPIPLPRGWTEPFAIGPYGPPGGPTRSSTQSPEATAVAAAVAGIPMPTTDAEHLRADAVSGLIAQNSYDYPDDELLLIGLADEDPLTATVTPRSGDRSALAVVVVHVRVAGAETVRPPQPMAAPSGQPETAPESSEPPPPQPPTPPPARPQAVIPGVAGAP